MCLQRPDYRSVTERDASSPDGLSRCKGGMITGPCRSNGSPSKRRCSRASPVRISTAGARRSGAPSYIVIPVGEKDRLKMSFGDLATKGRCPMGSSCSRSPTGTDCPHACAPPCSPRSIPRCVCRRLSAGCLSDVTRARNRESRSVPRSWRHSMKRSAVGETRSDWSGPPISAVGLRGGGKPRTARNRSKRRCRARGARRSRQSKTFRGPRTTSAASPTPV